MLVRLNLAIPFFTAVLAFGTSLHANIIDSQSLTFANSSPPHAQITGVLSWEIWEGTGTSVYGVSLSAGEFGYFFQVHNQSPIQGIETFSLLDNFATESMGVASGLILNGGGIGIASSTVAAAAGSLRPLPFANTGSEVYWNFQGAGGRTIRPGMYSDAMYFIATQGPQFTGNGLVLNPGVSLSGLPTPVPEPSCTLGILLLSCSLLARSRNKSCPAKAGFI